MIDEPKQVTVDQLSSATRQRIDKALNEALDYAASAARGKERMQAISIAYSFCPVRKTHGEQCRDILCTACAIATQINQPIADIKRIQDQERAFRERWSKEDPNA
jgi:predicted urease superfamily metal-dependent hydrolase